MKTLIKGGTLVTSTSIFQADILIDEEKIVKISEHIEANGEKVIEASGKLIFPGFIDTHTHFDLEGACKTADDFYTGTKAAIVGGTTMVLDFATQDRGMSSLEALEKWQNKAKNKSSCDYGFHMSYTQWNEELLKELPQMFEEGISSFKLYMAYDHLMVTDEEMEEILLQIKPYGGLVGAHCEIGEMVKQGIQAELLARHTQPMYHSLSRPSFVEAEAIKKFLKIAKKVDVPVYIVHLSSDAGLQEIRSAKENGQKVYTETCPQYLLLDDSYYNSKVPFEGAKYVCAPPLRNKFNKEILWKAIENDQIDTIGTDHCSFNFIKDKELGRADFSKIPNGLPGVEHRPSLIFTFGVNEGRISLSQMTKLLSTNPARLFGLYPEKGELAEGSDADIVIWDPEINWEIKASEQLQNVDYTPYEGMMMKGRAETVYLRGTKVVDQGKIISENQGKFVKRKKSITL